MRATTATVSLGAIKRNLEVARSHAPGSKIVAVIKANAYGHGAVEVAGALGPLAGAFAVALMDEAVQLRDAGIDAPVLVFQGASQKSDFAEAAGKNFWLMLNNRRQVEWVLNARLSSPVRVWLKADTGLNRLGLPLDSLDPVCESLVSSANVAEGLVLCSHLACADELDNAMTAKQVRRLRSFASKYRFPISMANSAAIIAWPESHAEWNRPGYMLFGNSPFGAFDSVAEGLLPAMDLSSEIIAIHDLARGQGVGYGQTWIAQEPARVATVAIGYGDGYPRHAPSGTPVLVNGQRAPLIGAVSMDSLSVDVTGLEDVQLGDPVLLWGGGLSVNEVAVSAGTIGYELLAGMTGRVPLVHVA